MLTNTNYIAYPIYEYREKKISNITVNYRELPVCAKKKRKKVDFSSTIFNHCPFVTNIPAQSFLNLTNTLELLLSYIFSNKIVKTCIFKINLKSNKQFKK